MRDYEMMYIIHPEQDAAGLKVIMDSLDTRINRDGTVTAHDLLGRRRLAYPMKKQTQGIYCLINFTISPELIGGLQQFLAIDHHETVLKYLLLVDEKRGIRPTAQTLPEISEEALAAAAAEAEEAAARAVLIETEEGLSPVDQPDEAAIAEAAAELEREAIGAVEDADEPIGGLPGSDE